MWITNLILLLLFENILGGGEITSNIEAAKDSSIKLSCSDVTPNTYVLLLEWKCVGLCTSQGASTLIKFTRGRNITEQRDPRFNLDTTSFDLHISSVRTEDTGSYYCLVNNKESSQDKIKLKVLAPTEPTSRPMVLKFTSRTVSLSWTRPSPSPYSPDDISQYVITINWKNVNEDDNSEFKKSASPPVYTNSSQTNYTLTGLQPYTVYNFQVQSVNSIGKSLPSRPSYPTITLREKPTGRPQVTVAHNTSSTSIYLEWTPPPTGSIHGEFQGYIITYRPRDSSPAEAKEINLPNSKMNSYTISDLAVYTQYLVSIKVFNPAGMGPETIVVVMTDEGAPSIPRNLKILKVGDKILELTWKEPSRTNGVLQGYRVYFKSGNLTSVQSVADNSSQISETLTNLKPYTRYEIWVKAFTAKYEGKPTTRIQIWTDVLPPGQPDIVSLTCQSGNTMFVKWTRPKLFFRTVDVYYVMYRGRTLPEVVEAQQEEELWEEQIVETVNNTINHMMYLNNLTTNQAYEVKVRAGTKSHLGAGKMHLGPWSPVSAVYLQPGCENMNYAPMPTSDDRFIILNLNLEEHIGLIAGVVSGTMGLLLVIFAVLICRKYKDDSVYYDNEKFYNPPLHNGNPGLEGVGGWDVVNPEMNHSIPVQLFPKHVMDLHMNQEVGFCKEYEEIRAASCLDDASCLEEFNAQDAQKPCNLEKNRYPNIIAFDHTRVRLKGSGGKDTKDMDEYLNANYVDGYRKPKAYIATQGPLKSTTELFWRMVLEQNVSIIVMITHLYEGGKSKCDQYWPNQGTEEFGDIELRLEREDILAFYTLRTFSLRSKVTVTQGKKTKIERIHRTVYQYHYTAWPDHGVPLHALPLITFARNSAAANPENAGPIVVHCSAGVGRTGCYIVIHSMLQMIVARGEIDIFSYLQHIRGERNGLVQTEEQYIFIHDALVEAIEAGETHITKSCLPKYIHSLQCIDVTDGRQQPFKVIERQYKSVGAYHAGKSQYSTALKICNQSKNRDPDILPTDSHRVFLSPGSPHEGSDYINASWLTGFYNRKGFIVSQHPLDNTVSALWQLVTEQEVEIMVVLTSLDNDDYRPFWPTSFGSEMMWDAGYSQFTVSLLAMDEYFPRTIRLRLETGGVAREVTVIETTNWPAQCSPLSRVFDLVKQVEEETIDPAGRRSSRPILAIDRNGGRQAGTFCALMSLWQQLEFEGCVDVYQLAKLYHYSRPGIWRSQEDYLFMYCALEAYITNNGTTIPSPVDIDDWRNGYQLNGCVRVSKVYTDSVDQTVDKVWDPMAESLRIPPDGQESASLLRHQEEATMSEIPMIEN